MMGRKPGLHHPPRSGFAKRARFITFPQDMPSAPPLPEIEAFIARWSGTAQAERANYARFLDELCPIIEVPKPDPATGAAVNAAGREGDQYPLRRTLDGGGDAERPAKGAIQQLAQVRVRSLSSLAQIGRHVI
jgi:hypothetical protein